MQYDDSYKHRGDRPGFNWGDYEFTDHGYDQLADDPTSGIVGKVPGVETLTATEQRGRLQFVRSDVKAALIQTLAFTQLQILDPGPPTVAKATPMLTGGTSNWFAEAVAQGNAVLIDIEAAKQGQASFVLSKRPEAVAKLAFVGYAPGSIPSMPVGMAIIDGPPQLLDAAVEMSKPAPVVPNGPPMPPVAPPMPSAPRWMLPAVVGLGALGVVALVVSTRKR
jgi:hypothetical protein